MRKTLLLTYWVHLYCDGFYSRTLPEPMNAAAAEAFVESYNRLGQSLGRTANATACQGEPPSPTNRRGGFAIALMKEFQPTCQRNQMRP